MSTESEDVAEEDDRTRRERLVDQALLLGLFDDCCNSIGIETVSADGLATQSLCDVTGVGLAVTGSLLSVLCSRHDLEE